MPRGVSWWHLICDALSVLAGFYLAHLLRFGLIPAPKGLIALGDWMSLACFSLPVWLFIGALHGLYYTRLKQSFASELASVTHTAAEGLLATILLTFAFRALP